MVRDNMSNFKKILVALDGTTNSFRGLDSAIYLARQFQTTITGLYVIPMDKPHPNDPITSMEKLFLKNASKFMEKAKKKAAQNNILFVDKIVYGDDGVEIVRIAKRNNFDLIIIGSRGISLVKEIFIGGTSNYVLHKAPMPVLIVK